MLTVQSGKPNPLIPTTRTNHVKAMSKQKNNTKTVTGPLNQRPKDSKVGSFGGAFKTNEGGSKELERPTSG
jgi:hypothetical protein